MRSLAVGVGIFLLNFVADFLAVRFYLSVAARAKVSAANVSAILLGLSYLSIFTANSDHWLTMAAMAGAWTGTYLGFYRSK